jgi:hypothetical protein
MSTESNRLKDRLLGMANGTAWNRLRRLVLFMVLQRFKVNICFRCGKGIERVEELSFEHKTAWQSAPDPKASFFDLDNVAFSHLRCNIGSTNNSKRQCLLGHPFDDANTRQRRSRSGRKCRECERLRSARRYREGDVREKRKLFPSRRKRSGGPRAPIVSKIQHGTPAAYNHWGCRCQPCREARSSYQREYRQRRRSLP